MTHEDPHTKLHIYEGDSAYVVRDNGNKSLYGVQLPELLALFNEPLARAAPTVETPADVLLTAYVSKDGTVTGLDHETDADWSDVQKAHVSLRDWLNERIANRSRCPMAPAAAPTVDAGELVDRLKQDATQLRKMSELAAFGGEETGVRVKSVDLLLADLDEAAARLTALTAERDEARESADEFEMELANQYANVITSEREIARLREALEQIAEHDTAFRASLLQDIARAALGRAEGDGT